MAFQQTGNYGKFDLLRSKFKFFNDLSDIVAHTGYYIPFPRVLAHYEYHEGSVTTCQDIIEVSFEYR